MTYDGMSRVRKSVKTLRIRVVSQKLELLSLGNWGQRLFLLDK